jgi:hypothetical protein
VTHAAQPSSLLLKLALRACERGDFEAAADALRGVLAMEAVGAPPVPEAVRAVSLKQLARILGYSDRHVRSLRTKGIIAADAVLSCGRGTRIFVDRAIQGLRADDCPPRIRDHAPLQRDQVETEGVEFVRRRSGLRVITNAASTGPTPKPER